MALSTVCISPVSQAMFGTQNLENMILLSFLGLTNHHFYGKTLLLASLLPLLANAAQP
jgi:hypothetical protein